MSLEQDLMAIEKTLWTGGPEAYQAATDDQCLVVFSEVAGVMPRDEIAKSAKDGRWSDIEMTLKGFMQMTPDAAVITYDCTAKKEGEPYHAVVSSGYVKRPGGWKLAFHQQTPLQ